MAMDEETALARVDAVKRAIEQADIETIAKHIRLVDAATKYAKAKKWSTTAWEAGAWSMEARRAAGKILLSLPKNPGTRTVGQPKGITGQVGGPVTAPPSSVPRLADLLPEIGVSRREAYYWETVSRGQRGGREAMKGSYSRGSFRAGHSSESAAVPLPMDSRSEERQR